VQVILLATLATRLDGLDHLWHAGQTPTDIEHVGASKGHTGTGNKGIGDVTA
jgi:hypothetical protein